MLTLEYFWGHLRRFPKIFEFIGMTQNTKNIIAIIFQILSDDDCILYKSLSSCQFQYHLKVLDMSLNHV